MDTAESNSSVSNRNSSSSSSSSSSHIRFRFDNSASNLIQAPLSSLLDYFGVPRMQSNSVSDQEMQASIASTSFSPFSYGDQGTDTITNTSREEVSIRIFGSGEEEHVHNRVIAVDEGGRVEEYSLPSTPGVDLASESPHGEYRNGAGGTTTGAGAGAGAGESSYQRYEFQQIGRWVEQILPFSLLLLVVFIRQHLLGFFGAIWISVVLFKSNDILRKQTALKGDRKMSVLVSISLIFILHMVCIYWWYPNNDLTNPLVLLPTKVVPPFWHAIFIIIVNDTMVRQAAMVFKCLLLMYFKNSGGHNYRKQGQMLTLVEYMLLLYRALLPTPVWYSFFLNKEYGSLFSSLITGLYLTFKLTSVVQKVQLFFAALRALSRKQVHYGMYATSEQIKTVGDLCAICQEKMHAPISLCCKHIFCEDCVSEWFERERTCPLCRALVKPANIKSYGDGSTSLLFQLF